MSSIISANLQVCGFLEQSACLELDSFLLSLVKNLLRRAMWCLWVFRTVAYVSKKCHISLLL